MSKHTAEPWMIYKNYNDVPVIGQMSKREMLICSMIEDETYDIKADQAEMAANAARIVACVNAMAGIDDPAAELERLREIERIYDSMPYHD